MLFVAFVVQKKQHSITTKNTKHTKEMKGVYFSHPKHFVVTAFPLGPQHFFSTTKDTKSTKVFFIFSHEIHERGGRGVGAASAAISSGSPARFLPKNPFVLFMAFVVQKKQH